MNSNFLSKNDLYTESITKTQSPVWLVYRWRNGKEKPVGLGSCNARNKKILRNCSSMKGFRKVEEAYILAIIIEYFGTNANFEFQYRIPHTKFIVDLLMNQFVCIEVDENGHRNYCVSDEIDRNELLSHAGYKTIHINPSHFYLNADIYLHEIENQLKCSRPKIDINMFWKTLGQIGEKELKRRNERKAHRMQCSNHIYLSNEIESKKIKENNIVISNWSDWVPSINKLIINRKN